MNSMNIPRDLEQLARDRLENNGRNPANNNAGIRTGSDLHLCEVLLKKLDIARADRLEMLAALKEARTQLEAYEQEKTGETYNSPSLNATIARAESRT